jgi:hypothetical protein
MLMGLVWLALILAICVHHQKASARHRQWLHSMEAAGMLPGGPRRMVPANGSAPLNAVPAAMSIPPSPVAAPPTVAN